MMMNIMMILIVTLGMRIIMSLKRMSMIRMKYYDDRHDIKHHDHEANDDAHDLLFH